MKTTTNQSLFSKNFYLKPLFLKIGLAVLFFASFISMNAQVETLTDYENWTLEKVVIDGEETLAEANNYGVWVDISFWVYQDEHYSFHFDDVGSNIILDETNQSFTIIEDSFYMTLGGSHETAAANAVSSPFLYVIDSETYVYSFKHPFEYEYTVEGDLIYLDITNSEGDVVTFWANTLSNENFEEIKFSIYPNPAKDLLYMESQQKNIEQITIYNLNGKQVLSLTYIENQPINVSSLAKGIYLVKVKTENGSLTKKLIKD